MQATSVLKTRPMAIHELVGAHARELSSKLQAHRLQLYPPAAAKTLRTFSSSEAAKLIGVNDGYLRKLSLEGKGPSVETGLHGRRFYLHVNPDYFAKGSQFLRGILLHEVHHIVLGHLSNPRLNEVTHLELMELAKEVSANEYIEEETNLHRFTIQKNTNGLML